MIGALLMSKLLGGKVDVTMAINGALAGLVAITAGPDTPAAGVATLIGFIGGLIVYFSVIFIDKNLKIDDPVGAISVHGVVGIWGILAVPLTSDATVGAQLLGIISIIVWKPRSAMISRTSSAIKLNKLTTFSAVPENLFLKSSS